MEPTDDKDIIEIVNTALHSNVESKTIDTIGRFLLLWGIYERTFYPVSNPNGIDYKFNHSEARKHLIGERIKISNISIAFDYLQNRYITDSEKGLSRFNELEIKGGNNKETLDIISNSNSSPIDKQWAILTIMYQLRNNLFHGKKEATELNDNKNNFDIMNAVLVDILCKP